MARSPLGVPGAVDPDRTAWVDVARALCIVLVVMMHATLGWFEKASRRHGFSPSARRILHAHQDPDLLRRFRAVHGPGPEAQPVRFRPDADRASRLFLSALAGNPARCAERSRPRRCAPPHPWAITLAWSSLMNLWFLHVLISSRCWPMRCAGQPARGPDCGGHALSAAGETGSVLIDEFTARASSSRRAGPWAPLFFATARLAVERPTLSAALVITVGVVNLIAISVVDLEMIPLVGLFLGLARRAGMATISALARRHAHRGRVAASPLLAVAAS